MKRLIEEIRFNKVYQCRHKLLAVPHVRPKQEGGPQIRFKFNYACAQAGTYTSVKNVFFYIHFLLKF